jgi:hypothetical protein
MILILAAGFGLYVGEFLIQEWRDFRAEQRRRKYARGTGRNFRQMTDYYYRVRK